MLCSTTRVLKLVQKTVSFQRARDVHIGRTIDKAELSRPTWFQVLSYVTGMQYNILLYN